MVLLHALEYSRGQAEYRHGSNLDLKEVRKGGIEEPLLLHSLSAENGPTPEFGSPFALAYAGTLSRHTPQSDRHILVDTGQRT